VVAKTGQKGPRALRVLTIGVLGAPNIEQNLPTLIGQHIDGASRPGERKFLFDVLSDLTSVPIMDGVIVVDNFINAVGK